MTDLILDCDHYLLYLFSSNVRLSKLVASCNSAVIETCYIFRCHYFLCIGVYHYCYANLTKKNDIMLIIKF